VAKVKYIWVVFRNIVLMQTMYATDVHQLVFAGKLALVVKQNLTTTLASNPFHHQSPYLSHPENVDNLHPFFNELALFMTNQGHIA
jgi:hypothetical protein